MLNGGPGGDRLVGGPGNDAFLFDVKPTANSPDHIYDFTHGEDKIQLDSSVFKALKPGKLHKAEFFSHKKAKAAHDSDDRVVYDKKSAVLYYDKDGDGGAKAVKFAILASNSDDVSAKDFLIVA